MRDDLAHASCRQHLLRRARDRQIHFDDGELDRLEKMIERSRRLYEKPGQARYRIGVRRGRVDRLIVVFDIDVGAIVTVYSRQHWRSI